MVRVVIIRKTVVLMGRYSVHYDGDWRVFSASGWDDVRGEAHESSDDFDGSYGGVNNFIPGWLTKAITVS